MTLDVESSGPGAGSPDRPDRFRPYRAQLPFLTRRTRYHAFVSGVGAGKTVAGILRVLKNTEHWNPGEAGCVIAPTVPSLRNVIIPELEKWGIIERCDYNRSENILKTPNDSKIILESADNDRKIQRLRGLSLSWFWMDEAAVIPEQAWDVMVGRLREGQYLNAFVTTTPKGKNWVHNRFVNADDTTLISGVPTTANPHTPEEYRQEIVSEYEGTFYEQEVLGKFTKFEGLVYPWFDSDTHVVTGDDAPAPGDGTYDQVIYGVDWGHNNPAVVLAVVRRSGSGQGQGQGQGPNQDQWVVAEEWYERRCTVNDHARAAEDLQDRWGPGPIYCDPSEPANIETFQRDGLDARKAKNDVMPGIQHISALRDELRVAESCQSIRNEFAQYQYKDGGDGDKPLKQNDHALDAARYCLFTHTHRGGDPFIVSY